jgi:FMN phosphatase YigB (HAD superfamily)
VLPEPVALLLDFGGVLADAPPQRAAPPQLVLRIYNLTRPALTPGQIQRSLTEGDAAYARWRDQDEPDELSQAEVWERFVIGDWPRTAQVAVRASVAKLSYDWAWRSGWALRPGVEETLRAAAGAGLPMAVVSNTLCGAAHRDFLARAGVGELFGAQIYSDEAGVRKPNPQMIWNATDQLGVPPGGCWFVGDSRQRDLVCARRADVAAAILMRSPRTEPAGLPEDAKKGTEPAGLPAEAKKGTEPPGRWPEPDATVDDGFGLLELLKPYGRFPRTTRSEVSR